MGSVKIITIGDSHSYSGWNKINIPGVVIINKYLGPKLMYSFGKEKWIIINDALRILEGDIVVFCFGEIDARFHVHKYKENGTENVIKSLVKNYFKAIELNVKNLSGVKICIYFIPPALKEGEIGEDGRDPDYPYLGTDEERRQYVSSFNEKLSYGCKNRGYIFIDLHSEYCDQNGFLRRDMSDEGPHIKDISPLTKFILERLI